MIKVNELIKADRIPQLWVICIMLLYGVLMSEYFSTFNKKMLDAQSILVTQRLVSYLLTFNYLVITALSFVVWIITTLVYHLFAILFNGDGHFNELQKYTGLAYVFPIIILIIALFRLENTVIPINNFDNFIRNDNSIIILKWLIAIASYMNYFIVIPIIKYVYGINWLKSFGVVAIPLGSIFLLSQFFSIFVF